MLQEIKGSLYMMYANYKWSLISFWAVLVAIVCLSILSLYLFDGGDSTFTLSAPIYFYMPIITSMIVTGVFPFLIKLGVTRFPLFLSFGLFFIGTTLVNIAFFQLIKHGFTFFFGGQNGSFLVNNGSGTFQMNHLADIFPNHSIWTEVTVDLSISLLLSAVVLFTALIFYRFGKIIGFLFLGLVGLTFITLMNIEASYERIVTFIVNFDFHYFYYMIGAGLVIYLMSYLILHKMTITK